MGESEGTRYVHIIHASLQFLDFGYRQSRARYRSFQQVPVQEKGPKVAHGVLGRCVWAFLVEHTPRLPRHDPPLQLLDIGIARFLEIRLAFAEVVVSRSEKKDALRNNLVWILCEIKRVRVCRCPVFVDQKTLGFAKICFGSQHQAILGLWDAALLALAAPTIFVF